MRVPKAKATPDETIRRDESQKTSNTYVGFDTVDGEASVNEDIILAEGRKSQEHVFMRPRLCKHESLMATSTPMGTPGVELPSRPQLR